MYSLSNNLFSFFRTDGAPTRSAYYSNWAPLSSEKLMSLRKETTIVTSRNKMMMSQYKMMTLFSLTMRTTTTTKSPVQTQLLLLLLLLTPTVHLMLITPEFLSMMKFYTMKTKDHFARCFIAFCGNYWANFVSKPMAKHPI
jgi:hypothetical protein